MDVALVVTAAVLGFAAAVQMASGFGFALVATPLLAVAIDAHHAVLLALLSAVVFNGWQAYEGRRHRDTGVVVRLLAGAVVGMPGGYVVYRVADHRELTATIGILVVVAAVVLATGRPWVGRSRIADLVAGVMVGALTTSTGTNGPPAVVLLQSRKTRPEQFRATLTSTFFAVDLAAVVVFAAGGDLDLEIVGIAIVCAPALLVGGLLGRRCRALLSPEAFRVSVLALLAATGTCAVVTALV